MGQEKNPGFWMPGSEHFQPISEILEERNLDCNNSTVSRMGTLSKKLKREKCSKVDSNDEYLTDEDLQTAMSDEDNDSMSDHGDDASDDYEDQEKEEEEEEGEGEEEEDEEEEEAGDEQNGQHNDDEMEELEKEYMDLQNMEQNLIQNLKHHKDEDLLKGKAMRNQKALWDKNLEFRILLQKVFSKSNRLPQEPFRSSFCQFDEGVRAAYMDLIESSKRTVDSFVELQEALLENNPLIIQAEGNSGSSVKHSEVINDVDLENDEEWLKIAQMQARIATFRNKSVDKWHRKNEVSTGVAVKKGKLHAFNQNISDQVATYMRDPSKMIKSMQMRREIVGVFGSVPGLSDGTKEEATTNAEGDPELLDDTEFYQQLFKEFFETIDPNASEAAFYAIKRLQTKKRKVVDRRASKSRKIRYNVHEKIVNFMAPKPMNVPPTASILFENLFGLRTSSRPTDT